MSYVRPFLDCSRRSCKSLSSSSRTFSTERLDSSVNSLPSRLRFLDSSADLFIHGLQRLASPSANRDADPNSFRSTSVLQPEQYLTTCIACMSTQSSPEPCTQARLARFLMSDLFCAGSTRRTGSPPTAARAASRATRSRATTARRSSTAPSRTASARSSRPPWPSARRTSRPSSRHRTCARI